MTELRSSISEQSIVDHPGANLFDETDDLELQQVLEKNRVNILN